MASDMLEPHMTGIIQSATILRDRQQNIHAVHVQFGPGAQKMVRIVEENATVFVELWIGEHGVRLMCYEEGSEFQRAVNLLRMHMPRSRI